MRRKNYHEFRLFANLGFIGLAFAVMEVLNFLSPSFEDWRSEWSMVHYAIGGFVYIFFTQALIHLAFRRYSEDKSDPYLSSRIRILALTVFLIVLTLFVGEVSTIKV